MNNPFEQMKRLGFTNEQIDKVVVNPKYKPTSDKIAIYTELRNEIQIDGFTITGQADLIFNGIIFDYKTQTKYSYLNTRNLEKFIKQLSIYRLINRDLVNDKRIGYIISVILDLKKREEGINGLPNSKFAMRQVQLLSYDQTILFLKDKVSQIRKYKDLDEKDLPLCDVNDTWVNDPIYAYFSHDKIVKPRLFKSRYEADKHLLSKGKGFIEVRESKATGCSYCSAKSECSQYKNYVNRGMV